MTLLLVLGVTAMAIGLIATLSRFLRPRAIQAAILYLAVVYLLLALASTVLAIAYTAFGPSFSTLPREPGMVFGHVLFLTLFPTITVASLLMCYALLRRRVLVDDEESILRREGLMLQSVRGRRPGPGKGEPLESPVFTPRHGPRSSAALTQ